MKTKRLLAATALICVAAMLGGCSSDSPSPNENSSAVSNSTVTESNDTAESTAVTEDSTTAETADSPKAENTSLKVIPDNAFTFSDSQYANSDFLSYVYTYGYTGKGQSVTIYRYEDYLVLIVYHYDVHEGSYKEIRTLTQNEGEDFLAKAEKYTEVKKDSGTSSQTPAVGGIEKHAIMKLNSNEEESEAIQIEPLDLSKIAFELPETNEKDSSFFKYDYPEARWNKIFAGDEENTKKYFGIQSETEPENHSIPFSIATLQLDCVFDQIEAITGGKVEKAKFTAIGDDASIIEATLEKGNTYTVTINYEELVIDIA